MTKDDGTSMLSKAMADLAKKPDKISLGEMITYGAVAVIFAGVICLTTYQRYQSSKPDRFFDTLPAEIRAYGKDVSRSFDERELEGLLRDYRFEKR